MGGVNAVHILAKFASGNAADYHCVNEIIVMDGNLRVSSHTYMHSCVGMKEGYFTANVVSAGLYKRRIDINKKTNYDKKIICNVSSGSCIAADVWQRLGSIW